jgi:predicted O-methyltransferase YrrM
VTETECVRLAELATDKAVVEIGSHYGRSTIALASTAAVVHTIDWHRGDPHGRVDLQPDLAALVQNLERYGVRERVVIHVARAEQVLPALGRKSFDLAFIDGSHDEPDVIRDALLTERVLRRGSLLAFHDYGRPGVVLGGVWLPFGVTAAVMRLYGDPDAVTDTVATVRRPRTRLLDSLHYWARARRGAVHDVLDALR